MPCFSTKKLDFFENSFIIGGRKETPMPRDLTHVVFADEIREKLSPAARKDTGENPAAYHMGAIAHDAFLYGSQPKLATKIHGGLGDDTRAVIIEMMDDARAEKNPDRQAMKRAFVYGFLSHAAVDATFHPFVYSVSGSQVPENNPDQKHVDLAKTRHRYIETWLDVHFLREKGLSLDTFKPFKQVANDRRTNAVVPSFFCESYEKAYGVGQDLTPVFKNSMKMQLFVGRVTQNQPLGRTLRALDNALDGRLGLAVSGFYQNDRAMPPILRDFESYKHPVTGKTVAQTLKGLTADAVALGTVYIAAAEKYIRDGVKKAFLKAVPNVNLDTGVENTKLADIKQATPADVEKLKGEKIKAFMRKGFKAFPSGARNAQNERRQTANIAGAMAQTLKKQRESR